MGSNYRVREANVEDAAEICGLARELAETVGDEPPTEKRQRGAARGAPGRTQGGSWSPRTRLGSWEGRASGSNPISPTATSSSRCRC